jgi:hypothetical protein
MQGLEPVWQNVSFRQSIWKKVEEKSPKRDIMRLKYQIVYNVIVWVLNGLYSQTIGEP